MNTKTGNPRLPALAFALGLALATCGTTATPPPQGGGPSGGLAAVDRVEIVFLESFPIQVRAVVKGFLPDGCTTIDEVTQERVDETFRITLTTTRPADKVCTEALVPFEEAVSLEVYGLPAGTYAVDANGVTATFTFDIDNAPQG